MKGQRSNSLNKINLIKPCSVNTQVQEDKSVLLSQSKGNSRDTPKRDQPERNNCPLGGKQMVLMTNLAALKKKKKKN